MKALFANSITLKVHNMRRLEKEWSVELVEYLENNTKVGYFLADGKSISFSFAVEVPDWYTVDEFIGSAIMKKILDFNKEHKLHLTGYLILSGDSDTYTIETGNVDLSSQLTRRVFELKGIDSPTKVEFSEVRRKMKVDIKKVLDSYLSPQIILTGSGTAGDAPHHPTVSPDRLGSP